MAPKRPSPLDKPPAASSSEEEEVSSEGEEEESGSGSGSGSEAESESEEPTPISVAEKKAPPKKPESATLNSKSKSKPQSSSSASESESESDSDKKGIVVKPIASKPMEETTPSKTKKPRSKPSAVKAGSKRPISEAETKDKDSKRPNKKKALDLNQKQDPDPVEEETTTQSDSKKLFQRIWSDEDEIIILKGMADYAAKKGSDVYSDMMAFHESIKKSLKVEVNKTQLQDKIRRLKKKYEANVAKGNKYNPAKPHDQIVFDLSRKVWGGGGGQGSEQSKSNGKAKSNVKGDNKSVTLASLRAVVLSSPEPPKEAEKADFELKACGSESLSEVIGYDRGFRELGLPEAVVKQGLELIGGPKRAEYKGKWKKLHVAELELFVKRTELMRDQAKVILDAFKSSDH